MLSFPLVAHEQGLVSTPHLCLLRPPRAPAGPCSLPSLILKGSGSQEDCQKGGEKSQIGWECFYFLSFFFFFERLVNNMQEPNFSLQRYVGGGGYF